MNKMIFLFSAIFLLTLVSAQDLGTFKYNESMQLYQSCPTCTYVTLTSVHTPTTVTYPNTNMTKNGSNYYSDYSPEEMGEYYYVVEGDKDGTAQTESINFYVTITGEEYNPFTMGGSIILILGFVALFILIDRKSKEKDFEKMKDKLIAKYQDRNYVKLVFSTLWYSLLSEKFVLYYLIGFPIVILLANLSFMLNISSVVTLMKVLLGVYSYGGILVGLAFVGKLQELIKDLWDKISNMNWGIE